MEGQGQGCSKIGYTEFSQEEVDSAGVLAEGFGNWSGAEKAEQADARIAEGGHILGGEAAANSALVFPEHHVANPMQAVFDAPMAAPPIEELHGGAL